MFFKSGRMTIFVKPTKVEEDKANVAYLDKGKNDCVKPMLRLLMGNELQPSLLLCVTIVGLLVIVD